jgi:uncharacterized membrane protein YcaP (DUF421 family)
MESVLRGAVTYLFVWAIFRLAGKRSLAQITTFDAVLLLIISETTQAALTDNDNSVTNSILLIMTILGIDIFLSYVKQWSSMAETILDGRPLVVVEKGELREYDMKKERIDKEDILHAARQQEGIGALSEIEYAVLEQSGGITVVPKRE